MRQVAEATVPLSKLSSGCHWGLGHYRLRYSWCVCMGTGAVSVCKVFVMRKIREDGLSQSLLWAHSILS